MVQKPDSVSCDARADGDGRKLIGAQIQNSLLPSLKSKTLLSDLVTHRSRDWYDFHSQITEVLPKGVWQVPETAQNQARSRLQLRLFSNLCLIKVITGIALPQ